MFTVVYLCRLTQVLQSNAVGSRTVPWVVQWDERPTYSLWHPHRNAFHQLCPKSQQLAAKRRCPDFLASRDAVYKNYCTWHGGKPCKIMQNSCTCCIVHQPAYPSLYPETGLWIGEGLNPDAHQDMLCSTFERSWSIATTFHCSLARCHFRRGNVCAVLTSTQRMARHQGVRCARWRERHHQVAKPKLGVKMW